MFRPNISIVELLALINLDSNSNIVMLPVDKDNSTLMLGVIPHTGLKTRKFRLDIFSLGFKFPHPFTSSLTGPFWRAGINSSPLTYCINICGLNFNLNTGFHRRRLNKPTCFFSQKPKLIRKRPSITCFLRLLVAYFIQSAWLGLRVPSRQTLLILNQQDFILG